MLPVSLRALNTPRKRKGIVLARKYDVRVSDADVVQEMSAANEQKQLCCIFTNVVT